MSYDLNLSQSFSDFQELENLDHMGFCICVEAKDNLKTIVPSSFNLSTSKPLYSRVNIEYNSRLDSSTMNALSKFDLVCITGVDSSNISSVIKLCPDLIVLRSEEIKHLKKTFINTLKQKEIYVELLIKDALYNGKDRIAWMNNIRRLLKFGCSRTLIISTGATVFTELKSSVDICKLMGVFGLSDDKTKKILKNSENVLKNAALKRYSANGSVASNTEEGILKRDFIVKTFDSS